MNTDSKVSFDRARAEKQERYNPIRNLTPETLTAQIDSFYAGYLAPFARTMEAIKRRDDTLQPASAKREKAPSRRNWEIIINENLPDGAKAEAERHQEALTFFYNNLTVANAVDLNERGGFSLLRRQMMQALGYRYAAHHIVWQPTPDGLTAQLIYCPLWFFENRTGKLRYLNQPHTFDGVEMEDGEWLVSVNEGIMEVSAVAYMFKRLPLKDWLIRSQDYAKPLVEGITDAAQGSTEWETLKSAVDALAADLRIVRSRSAEIKLTDLGQQGEMPYEPLVERMDRRLAAIWRGGDLGTVSRADAVGAEGQNAETDVLEEDDCEWLSDTLNMGLDKLVIQNVFGPDTTPLAYVKVIFPRKQNVSQDIAVDGFLRDSGAPLGVRATLERYGRTMPDEDDEQLTPSATTPVVASPGEDENGAPTPGRPAIPGKAAGSADVQTALNGAQVTALADLAEKVATGQLPFDTGLAIATAAFPLVPPATIAKIFSALRRFKPAALPGNETSPRQAANEISADVVESAIADAVGARRQWLAPLSEEIDRLARLARNDRISDADFTKFVQAANSRLPELFTDLNPEVLADSLEASLGTAAVEGLREAIAEEKELARNEK